MTRIGVVATNQERKQMTCVCQTETWRNVVGYEGLYLVSDQGRVLRINGSVLIPNLIKRYPSVALWKDGKFRRCNIHRLVAAAFFGPSALEVNHVDGDKRNNDVRNLEYVTRAQNMQHAVRIGRSTKGSRNSGAKLNEAKVAQILSLKTSGLTQAQIAERFGVCQSNIQLILARKAWTHVEVSQ